jgi:putative transposase
MKRSEIRGKLTPMVRYRRNLVPGGTFFFTLTLADRRSSVLVDHVGLLRTAFRNTRTSKSFAVDAIVILPDHLHAILTLPPGDSDFPADGGRSRPRSRGVLSQRARPFSEWPFSSLHRYVRAGILPRDWGGDDGADNADFGERAE